MNRLSIIAPLAFAFAFSALSAPAARAQWSAPTSTPPLGNVASPLNVSGTGQTKIGGLTLNTGGATYGLLVPNGKVGVGTLSPASLLSVAGGLQVGDDTGTCDSSKAGTIRWHSGAMQICSSNAWSAFNPPTGAYGTCSTASSGTTDGGCVNYNPAYASSDKVQCAAQSPATCAAYNSTATNLCTCPSDWSLQLVRTNSVYVSGKGYATTNYYTCNKSSTTVTGACFIGNFGGGQGMNECFGAAHSGGYCDSPSSMANMTYNPGPGSGSYTFECRK